LRFDCDFFSHCFIYFSQLLGDSSNVLTDSSLTVGEEMKKDVIQAVEEMVSIMLRSSTFVLLFCAHTWLFSVTFKIKGDIKEEQRCEDDGVCHVQLETLFSRSVDRQATSMTEAHDFAKLSKNLQKRAEMLSGGAAPSDASVSSSPEYDSASDSEHFHDDGASGGSRDRRSSFIRGRSSRARFANKVLGRLYSRRAFTGGLVFSRGHFLGDVSKMVAGLLSSDYNDGDKPHDQSFPAYGFGDQPEGTKQAVSSDSLTDMVIHEQDNDNQIVHSSTLTAGKDGCVVLIFRKGTLLPFLDEYPGLLLSLLGTQVVV
jgi:hypothetical protein